jgi:hypothetical protein
LLAIGLATLAGRHIGLPQLDPIRFQTRHRATPQLTFGVGYGIASLACTLPLFLALVGAGAGVGGGGSPETLVVFAAYGAGMASVLMALAVGAALVRGGVSRWAHRVLRHIQPLAGVLLTVAGAYLVYFWVLTEFASPAETASDPLVAAVTDFAARIEARAESGGVGLVVVIAALVALAALLSSWQGRRRVAAAGDGHASPGNDAGLGAEQPRDPHRDSVPAHNRLALVAVVLPVALLGGLGHGLRPSSFSLLTVSGLAIGNLLGGAVIIEELFALPGLGRLLFDSVSQRDLLMVQGVVLVIAGGFVVINGVVDLLYTVLDPRLRERSRAHG